MPSIGTYHRSDRIPNCLIGATKRWGFQFEPWKVFDFPLENSGMDITYLYILVRTNLPVYVQVYRIPDGAASAGVKGLEPLHVDRGTALEAARKGQRIRIRASEGGHSGW